MVSLGKVLYATATILPVTQQIVGLGKMGYGLYKRYISPFTFTLDKLFNKTATEEHWKNLSKAKAWAHFKEGAALFIPIIGTIFAIYKLIISSPEKNNEEKKEIPKKTSPLDSVTPLKDQPLTEGNLVAKFAELVRNCKGKNKTKSLKKAKKNLIVAFSQEIKKANLIENLRNIEIGKDKEINFDVALASNLKKTILLGLNKNK